MIHIYYDFDYDEKQMIITMKIYNKENNRLIIEFPDSYGSLDRLYKNIKILESNIDFKDGKSITSKQEIMIKYTFKKYYDSVHSTIDERFNVIKNGKFLFFNAMNGLPIISNISKNVNITFSTNYNMLISSIGLLKKNNSITTIFSQEYRRLFFVMTNNYFKSKHIYVGYYDKSQFFIDLRKLILKLNKFIETCDKFFNVKNNKIYVISYQDFIYKHNKGSSYGSGYYYGFEYTNIYPKKPNNIMNHTNIYFAHELYHNYNVSGDISTTWISEGFTEFFCRFLLLSKQAFTIETNRFINYYFFNKYKNIKNSQINEKNYWKNENINKLPYQRGFIYALYLYQTYGNKFLNRYKKLIKTVNKLRKHGKYKMVNNNLFKHILNDNKFNDYIINGKTIEIKSSTYIGDIPHVKINDIF